MSLGAGTIDGSLMYFGVRVAGLHRVKDVACAVVETDGEVGFDFAAAAETPHGAADFVDEIDFEQADGSQFGVERFGDVGVEGFFAGTDKVMFGEEAVDDGVLRGDG